MLLTINIGNTNITAGVFKGNRLLKKYRFPTRKNHYFAFIKEISRNYKIERTIICSVVPKAAKTLNTDLNRLGLKKALVVGKTILVPLKSRYRNPQKLGQDRLVNSYAGMKLYGAPLIVADFGTAITLDIVSPNKEYLGGMILPGLRISLDALAGKTALLPRIHLSAPRSLIGKDTPSCILRGVVHGCSALTDGLVQKIKKFLGNKPAVVATGGDARLISRFSSQVQHFEPDLTLKGLSFLACLEKK
jgi:type III pantothenate kinase